MADTSSLSPVDLYRIHTDEVRFQVQLNWDRAKSSLTLHITLIALTAGLGGSVLKALAPWLFLFTAASALACARIVQIGHNYYRAARDQRKAVEGRFGVLLGVATTPGQRGERVWLNVTRILIGLHFMLALLACVGAWAYWARP